MPFLFTDRYSFTRRGFRFEVVLNVSRMPGTLMCSIARVKGGENDQFRAYYAYDVTGPPLDRPSSSMMLTYNPLKSNEQPDVNTVSSESSFSAPRLKRDMIILSPLAFFGTKADHFESDNWGDLAAGGAGQRGQQQEVGGGAPRVYEQDPYYTKQFPENFSVYDHQQQLPLTQKEQQFMNNEGLQHNVEEWKNQARAQDWRRPTEYQQANEFVESADELEQLFANAYSNYKPVEQASARVERWSERIRKDPWTRAHFDSQRAYWNQKAANEAWVAQHNVTDYPRVEELPPVKRRKIEEWKLRHAHPFKHQSVQSDPNLWLQDPQWNYRSMNNFWSHIPGEQVQTKQSVADSAMLQAIYPVRNTNAMPMYNRFNDYGGFGGNHGWGARH